MGSCTRAGFLGCFVAKRFSSSTGRAHVRPLALEKRQFYVQSEEGWVDRRKGSKSELQKIGMRYRILEMDERRKETSGEVERSQILLRLDCKHGCATSGAVTCSSSAHALLKPSI